MKTQQIQISLLKRQRKQVVVQQRKAIMFLAPPGARRPSPVAALPCQSLSSCLMTLPISSPACTRSLLLCVSQYLRTDIENTLRLTCHTTNFLTTSMSWKSSPTQHRSSLSDSEVQTRNCDSISNIGSPITKKIGRGLEHLVPAISVDKATVPEPEDAIPIAHVDTVHYKTEPVHVQEDTGTVITAAKTSTTISIVPKSPVLRTQPVLDTIEAESDGGQTATSCGTVMETGIVKLLKVADPPDAEVLRPYVCTFDLCTKPNHLFETRYDWYDHGVQHHRHEWYCAECTDTFSTSSGFTHHLNEIHPALLHDKQDVSVLIGGCERAMRRPQQCLLCIGWSEHASQLRSHLGWHMQQLALFTLPRIEMDENQEEDLASEAGLIGRELSDEEYEDEEEMSELEFNSNL